MAVNVRRLTRLSLLVALGLMLALVERQLPPPVPVPGVRLGLANAATLVALGMAGPWAALAVWFARFVLAAVFSGALFGPGFLVGGAGGLAAWAAMAALSRQGRFGAPGLSVAGAVAHHVGQLCAAAALTATPEVVLLLPALVGLGAPVGFFTGAAVESLLRRLSGAVAGLPAWRGAQRVADLGMAVAVLVGALVLVLVKPAFSGRDLGSGPPAAEVTRGGQVLMRLDLRQDGDYPLDLGDGHMVVQVDDGAVRVLESDCPDEVCVLTGWVREPGGIIVCAPYRVVVRVTGTAPGGPDVILR
ncbi:MAG TPA: Gx transporter family protein [Symbiobacteriaceae bacterium]|nr:Gx transporter family protein [Symbiobacteriaceae bacterium]